MAPTNYIPLELADRDSQHLYLDELLDLDVLCTEEGIFINVTEQ